jgi:hypothetical protein
MENFNWELFDHPPSNPDVAPSDWLRSQRFSDSELMEGVKT